MTAERRRPPVGDVHLRIWLADVAVDYTASVSAVFGLIRDWRQKQWCTFELIQHAIEDRRLPRLPYERLFLRS
ncbi:hypothetical protein [Nocardia xishanensis]|uniref:Uncharacterized protein n=1 Tax=Nocardia xishanensis TaxID=238964 RepID=A0ABW7X523_9NOCA